jgi:hypothetical protein
MKRWRGDFTRQQTTWLAVAILLTMFGLAVHSLVQKSPTFDEQGFITRGLGYVRGENRHMRVGHPLGLNALNALLLAGDAQVSLPIDDPSWQQTSFHRPSELFLWEIGNDVAHVMFLARLPTVFLAMLAVTVAGRWASDMSRRRWPSLLALFLLAFDPNILAHARLATTDLGLAAAACLSGFLLWRFLKAPSWLAAFLAGAGFGLLQNTKFTAGLFVPLYALVIGLTWIYIWWRDRWASDLLRRYVLPLLLMYPLAAFLTLWAAYGFDVASLPENLPTFSQLGGRTVPLAHYLEQLLDLGGRMQKSTPAFLLGEYSDTGWWYYFPLTFLLKTPLPLLLMLSWALGRGLWLLAGRVAPPSGGSARPVATGESPAKGQSSFASRHPNRLAPGRRWDLIDLMMLLVPPFGYLAVALTSTINLGYRHLLPLLPFLTIFMAVALSQPAAGSKPHVFTHRPSLRPVVILFLTGWLAAATVWIAPDFLAYFNLLAGGPDNGWRSLVDSNLDWGQDLAGLKEWLDDNGVDEVYLSYFGEARPEYYGIAYIGLPSNPPRLENPYARRFYPADPAPGFYAISATTLQGVHFDDHDLMAWFRDRDPLAKIGYSIFLYQVPAQGQPIDLALGSLQLDEIPVEEHERFGTNDVTPHWFDADQALLFTSRAGDWLVIGEALPAELAEILLATYQPVGGLDDRAWYRQLPGAQEALMVARAWQTENTETFSQGTGRIEILGYELLPATASNAGLAFLTITRVSGPTQPLKMFIHLLDSQGQIISQWDGLGAVWEGWQDGDTLVQLHNLAWPDEMPDGLPAGTYELRAGFYHPDTLERWEAPSGDRLFLQLVTIP